MAMRLTSKKLTNYLIDKLNKREEEYKRVMNIAPDGSDALCERKIDEERDYTNYIAKNQDEYRYVKLGQLEDIEDEFGIDLNILFQALFFKGIFVKWYDKHTVHLDANLLWLRTNVKPYVIDFKQSDQPHYLKDYGKTWALTKEELNANDNT